MAKDIVKEILLRFKCDTRDLEKETKKATTMVSGLNKTISGGSSSKTDLGKLARDYSKVIQSVDKGLGQSSTKLAKMFSDLAQKDLKQVDRQIEKIVSNAERRQRVIEERAKRGDAGKLARSYENRRISEER